MLFKLSNLNSNLALTLGYLNPDLNNSALNFNEYFTVRVLKPACTAHVSHLLTPKSEK